MPIYEYRCEGCAMTSTVLVRSSRAGAKPVCEHCGSDRLVRRVSSVARRRTAADVQQEYGEPRPGEAVRDPRQIGQWAEKRFEQFGMEMPKSTRDMIDAARDGVMPDEVDI